MLADSFVATWLVDDASVPSQGAWVRWMGYDRVSKIAEVLAIQRDQETTFSVALNTTVAQDKLSFVLSRRVRRFRRVSTQGKSVHGHARRALPAQDANTRRKALQVDRLGGSESRLKPGVRAVLDPRVVWSPWPCGPAALGCRTQVSLPAQARGGAARQRACRRRRARAREGHGRRQGRRPEGVYAGQERQNGRHGKHGQLLTSCEQRLYVLRASAGPVGLCWLGLCLRWRLRLSYSTARSAIGDLSSPARHLQICTSVFMVTKSIAISDRGHFCGVSSKKFRFSYDLSRSWVFVTRLSFSFSDRPGFGVFSGLDMIYSRIWNTAKTEFSFMICLLGCTFHV